MVFRKVRFAPSRCSAGELTLGDMVSAETELDRPLVVSGGPKDRLAIFGSW